MSLRNIFRSRPNITIKFSTWLLLVCLIVSIVFGIGDARLDGDILILIGLLVLVSLSDDLKEFNLWGFSGKKYDKEIREAAQSSGTAIPHEEIKTDADELADAQAQEISLMDNTIGNFLTLAFEIERLLRIYATVTLVKDVPSNTSLTKLVNELRRNEYLTDIGVKQVNAIRLLRNTIVHGRADELNPEAIEQGLEVALNLYNELHHSLYPPQVLQKS